MATHYAGTAPYQKSGSSPTHSQLQLLAGLQLGEPEHRRIKAYCDQQGIEFMSTAFDVESLEFLVRLGVRRIKVPSGEITNLPYLKRVGGYGLPVIVSTGMCELGK